MSVQHLYRWVDDRVELVRPAPKKAPPVQINFPKEDETVALSAYTFQLGAEADAVRVDLRIDEGAWIRCRAALGLWWCDWRPGADGRHKATARVRLADDTLRFSEPRTFVVRLTD